MNNIFDNTGNMIADNAGNTAVDNSVTTTADSTINTINILFISLSCHNKNAGLWNANSDRR